VPHRRILSFKAQKIVEEGLSAEIFVWDERSPAGQYAWSGAIAANLANVANHTTAGHWLTINGPTTDGLATGWSATNGIVAKGPVANGTAPITTPICDGWPTTTSDHSDAKFQLSN